MKILYVHQHFSSPRGSVGSRSYAMSQALIEAGHEVIMVCGSYAGGETGLSGEFSKGKREGQVDGVRVIEIDLPYSNNDKFIKRAGIFLKFALQSIYISMTYKYDLVFATTTPLTAGIPGIFARWFRRKPFVFEVRDLWPELPKAMGVIKNPVILCMLSLLEFACYRSAHQCIGLAPGIIEGIKKRGVPSESITLIPNGCDLDIFQCAEKMQLNNIRDTDTDLVAIYGGTHGFANGLINVLKAAKTLKTRGRDDIKIVLVGSGVKKNELIEFSEVNELTNVIFLDPVPKKSLAEYFKGADVGLQILANVPAFYYGTSPNKFFDYIASGMPVLVNYPGWVSDIVKENDCGWVVRADDPNEFASALEEAHIHKQSLSLTMGERSLIVAKRDFDRTQLSNSFIKVLESTATFSIKT